MTGDLAIDFGHEREQQIALGAQIIDELADRFAGECLIEQGMDSDDVARPLVANAHPRYCWAESLSISFWSSASCLSVRS